MKNFFLSLLLGMLFSPGFCQWLRDINGKPYKNVYDTDLQGSPIIFNDWRLARIKLKSQEEFDNVKVKFNPFFNSFYYNRKRFFIRIC